MSKDQDEATRRAKALERQHRARWNDWRLDSEPGAEFAALNRRISSRGNSLRIGKGPLRGDRMKYKKYPFYVITKSNRIASGWDYRSDADEFVKDHSSFGLKVITRKTAEARGIETWSTGSDLSGARGSAASKAQKAAYRGDCTAAKKHLVDALHQPKKTPVKAFAAAYKYVVARCGVPLRGAKRKRRAKR